MSAVFFRAARLVTTALLLMACGDVTATDAEGVLAKVSYERQQLRTAEFSIDVNTVETTVSKDRGALLGERQERWTGDGIFDAAIDTCLLRYRLTGSLIRHPDSQPNNQLVVTQQQPDGFLEYDETNQPGLTFFKDFAKSPARARCFAPIDPRCIGLASLTELINGRSLASAIEGIYVNEGILVTPVIFQTDEDAGTSTVSQIYTDGKLRKRIVFDVKRNWAPVRRTTEFGAFDAVSKEFSVTRVAFDSAIDWDYAEGVLVPMRIVETEIVPGYSVRDDAPAGAIDVTTTVSTIELNWASVNQNIDPAAFDYRQWGLPAETIVVDARPTENIVIGRIGDRSLTPVPSRDRSWRFGLFLAAAPLVAGLVVIVTRRWVMEK